MLLKHTPIEIYSVNGRNVYVKREDLFDPISRNAKMRGIVEFLSWYRTKKIGVYDTRVSRAGLGVAGIASEYYPGIVPYVYFAKRKDEEIRPEHKKAEEFGAKLMPVPATRTNICYYRARADMESKGGYMMPLGLAIMDSVRAVAREASTVPKKYLTGSLIICVGSGTILAGVLAGIKKYPQQIVGVSCGMHTNKLKRIAGMVTALAPNRMPGALANLTIIESDKDYYEREEIPCPWPADPNYDRKAFKYMYDYIGLLPGPILFWNIG